MRVINSSALDIPLERIAQLMLFCMFSELYFKEFQGNIEKYMHFTDLKVIKTSFAEFIL